MERLRPARCIAHEMRWASSAAVVCRARADLATMRCTRENGIIHRETRIAARSNVDRASRA
jgi:hypothetical protein